MKALLTLTQWLSPAFPVGSYAYSHGLETAITEGRVTTARDLTDWLVAILRHGAGASDAVVVCRALAGDDMAEIACALAASKERLQETTAQGASFAAAVTATGVQVDAAPLPVAVGCAARDLDLAAAQVAGLYLHSFTSNLVSCAVRFVPLGQAEGQGVLAQLHQVIEEVATWAATAEIADITNAAFASDMAAMRHERLQPRIFIT